MTTAALQLEITDAATPAERLAAADLAARIYCEEHLGRSWEEGRALLYDPEEALAASRVLVARAGSEVIATVWIHTPDPARAAAEGTTFGLPIERTFDLSSAAGRPLVQVSHAACHPAWRGKGVSAKLWRAALRETRDRELIICAATGLSSPRSAAALWARVADQTASWRAEPLDGSRAPGCEAPAAERLPWLIGSYSRLGLRAAGEPVFFPQFGMYDLPMWLPVRAA